MGRKGGRRKFSRVVHFCLEAFSNGRTEPGWRPAIGGSARQGSNPGARSVCKDHGGRARAVGGSGRRRCPAALRTAGNAVDSAKRAYLLPLCRSNSSALLRSPQARASATFHLCWILLIWRSLQIANETFRSAGPRGEQSRQHRWTLISLRFRFQSISTPQLTWTSENIDSQANV